MNRMIQTLAVPAVAAALLLTSAVSPAPASAADMMEDFHAVQLIFTPTNLSLCDRDQLYTWIVYGETPIQQLQARADVVNSYDRGFRKLWEGLKFGAYGVNSVCGVVLYGFSQAGRFGN